MSSDTPGPGPLNGLKVLDLTQALAGPFCTMLLADLGADVIKIEPPAGDMTRFGGPFTREDTERAYGGYFGSINRSKRSIVLDLKDRSDKQILLELVDQVDILVENTRVGAMERLGLGYETLAQRNPKLVYGCVRGFGDPRTGESPYAHWPAFDVVAQAMGGLVGTTGFATNEPVSSRSTGGDQVLKAGPSIGDIYPATLLAVGILAALHHAQQSGEGQFVDVAMYDAILALCEQAAERYSHTGIDARPTGNGHPVLAPFDIFATSDGWCAIAAPIQTIWPTLCQALDLTDLINDPRFLTNRERVANAAELRSIVENWTKSHSTADIVSRLGGRVPVGPVQRMSDIFQDPHIEARQMLPLVDQPDGSRSVQFAGCPIKLTSTPSGIRHRAPRLGEHTTEVLAQFGIGTQPRFIPPKKESSL